MRRLVLTLSLVIATGAFAQTPPNAPNPPIAPFPDDYRRSPCAATDVCSSFERGRIMTAGHSFLGYTISHEWLDAHFDELLAYFKPLCEKSAHCYPIMGSTMQWCNDLLMPEFRAACDRFEKGSYDWTQCTQVVDIWALGRDMRTMQAWKDAQACGAEKDRFVPRSKPPVVWMVPAKLSLGFKDYIRIYAVDPDTHTPVPAKITIDKQTVYAPTNATGMLWTYYPFKWPVKFNREPNAQGHRDLVAPMITVAPDGYPPVSFRMPIDVPKMNVAMTPATLKRGKNTVTVTAVDAATGWPVELRVMYGLDIVGESNKPFTLEVKGKRQELWATSLFERYSDVVILPAAK